MKKLTLTTAILIFAGCANQDPVIDDLDAFVVTISATDHSAERAGESVGESNVDVFTCRSTSASSEPLDQNAYFPLTPNHQLTFLEAVTGVSIRVISDTEFVLWIRSDTGNFCSDALGDSITRGSWSAGNYDVFIGTPTMNAVVDYTLVVE